MIAAADGADQEALVVVVRVDVVPVGLVDVGLVDAVLEDRAVVVLVDLEIVAVAEVAPDADFNCSIPESSPRIFSFQFRQ